MTRFYQHFAALPIGQGLFYTGELKFWLDYQEYHFNFVFDCGTMDKKFGDIEVGHYRKTQIDQGKLDLLIISHFDKDHISHIKPLIQGLKIKRIVMPFLDFEERLFLALRLIEQSDGSNDDDGQTIRFILDPIGEMGDNLDGDTEIYLVDADPDGPLGPSQLNRDKFPDISPTEGSPGQIRYEFDFPGKQLYADEVDFGNSQTQAKVFKVKDSQPAILSSRDYYLMDFHFYKKKLGEKDEIFFHEVGRLFREQFGVTDLNSLKDTITGITSATPVKKIFETVARTLSMKIGESRNLNTTALCMLHRNLEDLEQFVYIQKGLGGEINETSYESWRTVFQSNVRAILDRPATHKFPFESPYRWNTGITPMGEKSFFPNTLLTSDSFLLSEADLKAFESRYATLFPQAFIVQIPHHGSKHSSDKLFINLIKNGSPWAIFFCNYGIENKFDHPSEFWKDTLLNWNTEIYPVHQISGISYLNRYIHI